MEIDGAFGIVRGQLRGDREETTLILLIAAWKR